MMPVNRLICCSVSVGALLLMKTYLIFYYFQKEPKICLFQHFFFSSPRFAVFVMLQFQVTVEEKFYSNHNNYLKVFQNPAFFIIDLLGSPAV